MVKQNHHVAAYEWRGLARFDVILDVEKTVCLQNLLNDHSLIEAFAMYGLSYHDGVC